jgi:hypothetical protein
MHTGEEHIFMGICVSVGRVLVCLGVLGWVKLLRLFTAETGILREKDGRERGREGEGSREPRGVEWWGRKCTRVRGYRRLMTQSFTFSKALRFPMRARRFVLPRALAASPF